MMFAKGQNLKIDGKCYQVICADEEMFVVAGLSRQYDDPSVTSVNYDNLGAWPQSPDSRAEAVIEVIN